MLRRLSRQRPLQSLCYGRPLRRPVQWRSLAYRFADDYEGLTFGQRFRKKTGEYVMGFCLLMVWGTIVTSLPTWEVFIDFICRVVPPRTVSGGLPQQTIYGPTHQDPAIRQPITRPNEFRVLIVEPGSGNEEVRCRIVNVRKSWRTRYSALSYTWGDESIRETIIVDGLRTSVTKNLYSALVHLRDPVSARMLWVDALCINQDDPEERDEQVKQMNAIYSAARKVIIWLGEETPETKAAFSMIQDAPKNLAEFKSPWSPLPIFSLLRNPWFQRTWIIQEAVLAREPILALGRETHPWKTLSQFCKKSDLSMIMPNDPKLDQALRAVAMIDHGRHECHTQYTGAGKRRKKYTPNFSLVSTLYETREFQCKDKRDKVFGVLSMVTDVGPDDEVLRPNYRATMEEVLQSVAKWDITKNESLELLSYCSRKSQAHPDLPSWVPDYSDMDEANSIAFLEKLKPKKGPNEGFKDGNIPFFFQDNGKTALVVSGRVVDEIAKVGAITENHKLLDYDGSDHEKKRSLRFNDASIRKRKKWYSECVRIALVADPSSSYEHESTVGFWGSPMLRSLRYQPPIFTEFWTSETLGMSPDQFDSFLALMRPSTLLRKAKPDDLLDYTKRLGKGFFLPSDSKIIKPMGLYHKIEEYLSRFAHRRFCATRGGKLGWVPAGAAEGDLVCLISGAQVPIILRRVEAEGMVRYTVLGDAYVTGLMHDVPSRVCIGGERMALV
ncbi:hypothetical protein FDECE_892 [Fusarium decemcellulare]|nr:hypothetical protein FDECE_892 [Fusarium decemcellulare]